MIHCRSSSSCYCCYCC